MILHMVLITSCGKSPIIKPKQYYSRGGFIVGFYHIYIIYIYMLYIVSVYLYNTKLSIYIYVHI